MGILKRTVRGIRDSLPTGYMIGRVSSTDGPAELIDMKTLARSMAAATGGGNSSGGTADFGFFFSGKPLGSQVLFDMKLSKSIKIPAALFQSAFNVVTPPTADWTVTISKNGSSVGTIKFAATTGNTTITFGTGQTFNAGDIFKVTAQSTPDANLADVAFSFAATFA